MWGTHTEEKELGLVCHPKAASGEARIVVPTKGRGYDLSRLMSTFLNREEQEQNHFLGRLRGSLGRVEEVAGVRRETIAASLFLGASPSPSWKEGWARSFPSVGMPKSAMLVP